MTGKMHAPAATPEPEAASLSSLIEDPAFQVRRELNRETVRRYAEALRQGAAFPPVEVAIVNGAWIVVDGFHRIAAARHAGLSSVEAVATPATAEEAHWRAAAANLKHGLPLSRKELLQVFLRFIRAGRHRDSRGRYLSLRQIAQEMGSVVSHQTVANWLRQHYPDLARRMSIGDASEWRSPKEAIEDFERSRTDAAREALGVILANAKGVRCPQRRGELVQELERLLHKVRTGGPWVPPEPPDF